MCRDLGFWDFCVFRDLGFRVVGDFGVQGSRVLCV